MKESTRLYIPTDEAKLKLIRSRGFQDNDSINGQSGVWASDDFPTNGQLATGDIAPKTVVIAVDIDLGRKALKTEFCNSVYPGRKRRWFLIPANFLNHRARIVSTATVYLEEVERRPVAAIRTAGSALKSV